MLPHNHRRVEGLRRASALSEKPDCIPLSRPRGAKAMGLRFERALHKALPSSIHGQWFSFEDASGHGYCQTDLILPIPTYPNDPWPLYAVIEVKYTFVPGAHSKLSSLYLPVVEKAFDVKVAGVVVVKNLDPRFRRGRIYTNLRDAAEAAYMTKYPTLVQWSGQALLHQSAAGKAA